MKECAFGRVLERLREKSGDYEAYYAPHFKAQLRDASLERPGRHSTDSGSVGTREPGDDPALHEGGCDGLGGGGEAMSPEREVLRDFRKWSGWDPETAMGKTSALLVGRFLWLEKNRLKPGTWLGRRLSVLRFCRYWSEQGLKLTQLSEEDLRGYLEFRHAGGGFTRPQARRTINGELWSVRAFLAWLLATDSVLLVGELPGGLRKSKGMRRVGKALTIEEIEAWFVLCDLTDLWGIRDRAFFELAYGTGLRLNELLRLELTDVDLEDGSVTVGRSKNGEGRLVPLTERAAGWLKRYLDQSRPELPFVRSCRALLWCNAHGTKLTNPSVHKRISGLYATRLKFGERIGMHALRHSYATHLVRAGAGSEAVRRLLGHRRMNSTAIYTAVKVDDLRDVMKSHPREMDGVEGVETDVLNDPKNGAENDAQTDEPTP